jgi:hypothetical protein
MAQLFMVYCFVPQLLLASMRLDAGATFCAFTAWSFEDGVAGEYGQESKGWDIRWLTVLGAIVSGKGAAQLLITWQVEVL